MFSKGGGPVNPQLGETQKKIFDVLNYFEREIFFYFATIFFSKNLEKYFIFILTNQRPFTHRKL